MLLWPYTTEIFEKKNALTIRNIGCFVHATSAEKEYVCLEISSEIVQRFFFVVKLEFF